MSALAPGLNLLFFLSDLKNSQTCIRVVDLSELKSLRLRPSSQNLKSLSRILETVIYFALSSLPFTLSDGSYFFLYISASPYYFLTTFWHEVNSGLVENSDSGYLKMLSLCSVTWSSQLTNQTTAVLFHAQWYTYN